VADDDHAGASPQPTTFRRRAHDVGLDPRRDSEAVDVIEEVGITCEEKGAARCSHAGDDPHPLPRVPHAPVGAWGQHTVTASWGNPTRHPVEDAKNSLVEPTIET